MVLNRKLHRPMSRRLYRELLLKHRPSLVVVASPGYNGLSILPLIWAAQEEGIPTLCVTNGWDSLCGMKGMMPTRPDHLAVWNNLMKDEAVRLHRYRPEQVSVIGPPQFDIYQESIYQDRGSFLKRIGMNPEKSLITIATATAAGGLSNRYIVDLLVEEAKRGRFVRPVQFLCRLHPMDHWTQLSDYDGWVKVERPSRFTPKLGWDPDRAEMIYLANTMKHSNVVVNIASTVAIEAAIVDTPVVNVAFHPTDPAHFKKAVLEEHWEHHYRYVLERKASAIVRSTGEMVSAINRYLEHPELARQERHHLAEDLCYRLDGQAHQRLYRLLTKLLQEPPLRR